RTIALGSEPDGRFEHVPEPTAENLVSVAAEVATRGVDVGFCQDPDADRLALIDERGRYVGEEYTLAVTLGHALKTRKGAVVINCATSRMSQDLAAAAGCECAVSAVGEANVTGRMKQVGAVYGGEGNGGPIDPQVGYVRDSLVAMAQTLDALVAWNGPLSSLVDSLPRYAIRKSKVTIAADRVAAATERLIEAFPEAKADRQDGLRLDWPKAWLLVRASNTEPIVRIIAETASETESAALCDRAAEILSGA
ncbi:MAG TPA: phosphoglucosamine mutase, partial [Pirellulaceae bacterium]|nr:phosphoglucosamine mutase [Pirellulaceae bacterium]